MKTMTRDFSTEQLQVIRSFFTETEWDAIDSALADYQDYGDNEAELMSSIGDKMTEMFKRTVS
tara:strand:- start:1647 stop:1835 length:189 start_codon:yes stop_codon:yes gene_type:complete